MKRTNFAGAGLLAFLLISGIGRSTSISPSGGHKISAAADKTSSLIPGDEFWDGRF
jgi:hypothetical protein